MESSGLDETWTALLSCERPLREFVWGLLTMAVLHVVAIEAESGRIPPIGIVALRDAWNLCGIEVVVLALGPFLAL